MPPCRLPDDVRSNNQHATKVVLQHACHSEWSDGRRAAQRTYRQHATTVVLQPACHDSGLTASLPRGAVLRPPCHPGGLTVTQRSLPATRSGLTAVVPRLGFTDDMPPLRSYSLTVGMPPEWSCNMPATRQWSYSQPAALRTYRLLATTAVLQLAATKVVLQLACHSRWSHGRHVAQRAYR